MSESTSAPATAAGGAETDVPLDVTMAELNELVQLFNTSDWDGLEITLRGVHLVLGRRDAPSTVGAAAPAATGSAAPAPAPAAPAAAAPAHTAAPAASAAPATPPGTEAPVGTGRRTEVTAPVVGTFWVAPSPGEPPFVQVGDQVDAGQQLAIVEVMKLMSEVSSPVAGRVVEVSVGDAELVEFEQLLFVIESDDG